MSAVPARVECTACGTDHAVPERAFDPGSGTTRCPNCGERGFRVRREGIEWHPSARGGARVAWHCPACHRLYQQSVADPPPTECTWCGFDGPLERIDHREREREPDSVR